VTTVACKSLGVSIIRRYESKLGDSDFHPYRTGTWGHWPRRYSARTLCWAALRPAMKPVSGDVEHECRSKTARDLISSIIDRRLFEQAEHLRANYTHPVLILEGDPLAVPSRVRPNAIRGALARLAVTGRLPVLPSAAPEGTAALLVTLARQAQVEGGQERSPAKRRALSVTE
jgi:hypothetical protein